MATIHSAHDGPQPSGRQHAAKVGVRELQLAVCDEPQAILEFEKSGVSSRSRETSDCALPSPVASQCPEPLVRTLTSSATEAEQPTDIAVATAAVLELNMQVALADGLEAAGRVIVERLAQHLKLDRVAFASRRSTGSCSLIAVSGLTRFDQRSELIELLHGAANEAVARQTDGSWPPLMTANRHSLLAHRKLVEMSRVEAVASYRLTTSKSAIGHNSRTLGVLLVSGSRAAVHDRANVRFLTTAAKCLSATLELTARAEGGFVRRVTNQFRRAVSRRAFALMALSAIAVVTLMAAPSPYRISCRCVVEPMQRRFVVAPHDGLIETSLVQPGDVVRAGQQLARMDAREVRWELAGLEADRRQALQQRDTSLTCGELAKSELARLEIEQLDAKLELLRRRASLLDLQAPLDGIVLSGSLDKLSSAPVKTGQVLFEIAPLDRLRVEVSTPAEDYRHVTEGAAVELRFDGRLNELQTGTLARVRPRSEIRDSADVFVAEVEMDNPGHSLRPGQRGSAVVIGSSHPLAWNLFHKAADRVRQWLPF